VSFEKEAFLYTEEIEHEQEPVDRLEWQECSAQQRCLFLHTEILFKHVSKVKLFYWSGVSWMALCVSLLASTTQLIVGEWQEMF